MSNLYIFCGSDAERIENDIKIISEAENLRCERFNSVISIVTQLYSKSLISQKRCFVVHFDENFLTAQDAWQDILDTIGDDILILIYTTIDKRSKFYKFFKSYIKEYNVEKNNATFEFVDAVFRHDNTAFDILDTIHDGKLGILTLLYNRARTLLQIQETPRGLSVEDNTGLDSRTIYYAKPYLGRYANECLTGFMQSIDRVTKQIKSGEIADTDAVTLVVLELYSGVFI